MAYRTHPSAYGKPAGHLSCGNSLPMRITATVSVKLQGLFFNVHLKFHKQPKKPSYFHFVVKLLNCPEPDSDKKYKES